jgi:hypothetical protein
VSKREDYLLRHVWRGIHRRCTSEKDSRYHRYGGRGITVCEEWNDFERFKNWSYSHDYHEGLTIERIDNDGPYSESNCKWATKKEQANNTKNNRIIEFEGKSHTIAEWSEITGIKQGTILKRIQLGWSAKEVLTKSVRGTLISFNGDTKSVAEWSMVTGLSENMILKRIKRGWDIKKALTKKSQRSSS